MSKRARNHTVAAALVVIVIAALAGLLAVGCGENDPTVPGVPIGTTPGTTPQVSVYIYLVKGETPVQIERFAGAGGAQEALIVMLKGPTENEKQQGITTAIPAGTKLNSCTVSVQGDTAKVDFSGKLKEYGGGSAGLATIISQITRTVTDNDNWVKTVEISVDGVPAEESLQP